MSGSAENAAGDAEFSLFGSVEFDRYRFARLHRLVNAHIFDFESVLYVLSGDIEDNALALFHADHIWFNGEAVHRDCQVGDRRLSSARRIGSFRARTEGQRGEY